MEFVHFSDVLSESLEYIPLNILKDDASLYTTMLLQPGNDIGIGENIFHSSSPEQTILKFNKFVDLAVEHSPDLLVSPEYSCPWDSLSRILIHNDFPKVHQLVVVGCEAIRPDAFKQYVSAHSSIEWIYDSETIDQLTSSAGFLDVLCYVFYVKDNSGYIKVCVAQFKTKPMGSVPIERDNLILGKTLYYFTNPSSDIRLFSLICSDALNFEISTLKQYKHYHNLILHLQLNPRPFSDNFCTYRNAPYQSTNWGAKCEFLCINHAAGINAAGFELAFGGSCFYTKSEDIDSSDKRIDLNHRNGLYLTHGPSTRSFNYYFNYSEGVYFFRNTKSSLAGANVAHPKKTGPEMTRFYHWDNETNSWSTSFPDDGFLNECESVGGDLAPLTSDDLTIVDKERLICLSIGEVRYKDNDADRAGSWHKPTQLKKFKIGGNESIHRSTMTQYPDVDIAEIRRRHLIQYKYLKNEILNSPDQFPASFVDFRTQGCVINYQNCANEYHLNISTPVSSARATAAFLGQLALKDANRKRDELLDIMPKNGRVRLIVWYRDDNGQLERLVREARPQITDIEESDPRSFGREKND